MCRPQREVDAVGQLLSVSVTMSSSSRWRMPNVRSKVTRVAMPSANVSALSPTTRVDPRHDRANASAFDAWTPMTFAAESGPHDRLAARSAPPADRDGLRRARAGGEGHVATLILVAGRGCGQKRNLSKGSKVPIRDLRSTLAPWTAFMWTKSRLN